MGLSRRERWAHCSHARTHGVGWHWLASTTRAHRDTPARRRWLVVLEVVLVVWRVMCLHAYMSAFSLPALLFSRRCDTRSLSLTPPLAIRFAS